MSSPSSLPTARLYVSAADSGTELFVVDGAMRLRAHDRGNMTANLPPGVYTVRATAGGQSEDRMVVLRPDGQESVAFGRLLFASQAPLEATSTTHEYHAEFAERASRNVIATVGNGSWIFVMARAWRPADRPAGPRTNPAAGIVLRSFDGRELFDFSNAASQLYANEPYMDPCGGGTVEVDPGLYVLERPGPNGERLAQTVTALAHWQTHVFLLQRPADAESNGLGLLAGTSVLMRGDYRSRWFDRNDLDLRLGDLARLGLANDRQVLSAGPAFEVLHGKFRDPMLGLLGAHMLLAIKNRTDAEQAAAIELMRTVVVPNLRLLFGPTHPDVEALAIAAGLQPSGPVFGTPPMLRRSWAIAVDATASRPDLVPRGSPAAAIADRTVAAEPWLVWSVRPQRTKGIDIDSSLELDGSDLLVQHVTEGIRAAIANVTRAGRWPATERVVTGIFEKATEFLKKEGIGHHQHAPVDREQLIRRLVRSLGLPRQRVEELVDANVPAPIPVPTAAEMPTASATAPTSAFASGHALVIGIDQYAGPGIQSLPITVRNDAEDIQKLLKDDARCGYTKENVRSLFGPDATRSAILAELDRLQAVTTADSTVVLYVSSHGGQLADGEYLLPADTNGSSPEQVAKTAISAAEFSERVGRIRARKMLVILDCCHAAGVAALKGTVVAPQLKGDLYGRLDAGAGRAVLAACTADEQAVVLRDTDRNSLFTTHLLDGLRGKAATDDGLVKVFGLFEYVQLRVTGAYRNQHPVFKADLQDNFAVALNLAKEKGVVAREPAADFRYDACIAHAEEDFDWVAEHLVPALTREGLRHTVSGDALGQFRVIAVQDAVKKSKYVLPVISSHYTGDRVAQLAGILGLTQGLQQGTGKVIPVKIGEPTAEVGLAIEALVGVDLTKSPRRTEAEMAKLLRQLHEDPQTW